MGDKSISAKNLPTGSADDAARAPLAADIAHSILASAPIVLYVFDVRLEQNVFQNRRFGELLGHPQSESPLEEWQQFIHADDAAKFSGHRKRLKTIIPGETLHWEFRMQAADGNWRWFNGRDALMSQGPDGEPLLIVGSAADITEQKRAEQRKELLAGEMRHRAKNLVAVVDAIGRQSRPKGQPAAEAFIDNFMGRLLTLLNTGDIVLASEARTGDLGAVLERTLAPFIDPDASRIVLHGPAIMLSEHTVGGLALAAHELATNAVKYGALSVEGGSVAVAWSIVDKDGRRHLVLTWAESGGPPVSTPNCAGFGTRVIKQSVAHEPRARVAIDYARDGLRCLFEFQIAETGDVS